MNAQVAGPSRAVASVIVPAHNEGRVLTRCLDTLFHGSAPGELDVIVVANGCEDDTAELARRYTGVRVIETTAASKPLALNTGDRAADCAVRVFLDADVTIEIAAVRALVGVLNDRSGIRAAAPRVFVDSSRSSAPARSYLRVWSSLPVFDASYLGSGCYALSAEGRRRFGAFPDTMGDDRYVNRLFGFDEKLTLTDHLTTISAPRTLRGVIRRSVRVEIGSRIVDASVAGRSFADGPSATSTRAHLKGLARHPARLPDVLIFVGTAIVVEVCARYKLARRSQHSWARDETSRSSD